MGSRFMRIAVLLYFCLVAFAQDQTADKGPQIPWQKGPMTARVGDQAEVKVPEGFLFTGEAGTKMFLEATQNIPGNEVGMLAPESLDWFVLFTFDDVGFVKDDEKDKLDANGILASIKEGTEAGNEVRKEKGWSTMTIDGWMESPHYDEASHNLEWSLKGHDDDTKVPFVNHRTRLLGRGGVMNVELVADPQDMAAVMPQYRAVMGGYQYVKGRDYSSFVKGDKVAEYGLSALVLGGAAAAAAKTGLLKSLGKLLIAFWKVIAAGVIALGAAIKKMFAGRKQPEVAPTPES